MSDFEFVFSLFGLLLGLSLAEVLGGFAKSLKARHGVRIGWLTPMLGLLVMLDLTSFWSAAWAMRDALPVKFFVLMLLLLFTSAYYLTATMVFPDVPSQKPDFDGHYWENKRLIVGAIFVLNLPNYTIDWLRGGVFIENLFGVLMTTLFMSLLIALWLVRNRTANLSLLAILCALYAITGLKGMLG